jgi:uncharacterized protein
MRDDLIRRRLSEANPWWAAATDGRDPASWAEHDLLLAARAKSDIGYRSAVLDDLATAPVGDTLTLLQGPRRVGKSVAVRDLIVRLCQRRDVDTRQIVNLACDGLTAQDVMRALKLGRELTRSVDSTGPRPRVWLLDEITQIKGWATTLKHARDNTLFGGDTVVATGSSWRPDEDVEGNLLAGRVGTAGLRRLRLQLPMTFREYVVAARPNLPLPPVVHPAALMSDPTMAALDAVAFAIDDYDLAWQAYLTSGGFPRAVHALETTGGHDLSFLEDLHAWLRRDVDPESTGQESIIHLLAALARRTASPLDRTATSAALGYASKTTFERRLARLVASFAAVWCPQRDDRGRPVSGAQAKLYLTDPILAWIPALLRSGLAAPDFTTLTEQALATAVARRLDDLEPGRWIAGDTIGYLRTGSGNEIDLTPVPAATAAGPRPTTPLESKWVDSGWRKEALTIEGRFTNGILATKTILDTGHPTWAVPAPIIASLLG